MEQISIKNYRSIKESGEINILPLTVVVGRNSAGKSSFLRLFPLIKQTLESKIADSILWFGDYVDLGDFQHAISRTSKDEAIEISMRLNVTPRRFGRPSNDGSEEGDYVANVKMFIREKYFEKVIIEIYDQIIEIKMNEQGFVNIIVNGDDTILQNKRLHWHREVGDLLPILFEEIENSDEGKLMRPLYFSDDINMKCFQLIFGKKQPQRTTNFIAGFDNDVNIILSSKEYVLRQINKATKGKFRNYTIQDKQFLMINNWIIILNLWTTIFDINRAILQEMRQTSYVKPIRAMVNRYYRVQGISIDELDADGSNLPMILYNMSPRDLRKFEEWCREKFGVIFSVTKSVGHASLIVKSDSEGKEETNLADTGYGYSQMLPIVVLLWMLHNRKNYRTEERITKTIVIEQPELHLHPAYQAKMIDVFVNIIKEANSKGVDLKVIFETHSEAMVNRIGRLISTKYLDQEWVNILVFDKENDITTISSKRFNERGLLVGWPVGFFAADEVL